MTPGLPPATGPPMAADRVLARGVLVASAVVVAAVVVALVVGPQNTSNAEAARILEIDTGPTPWLLPLTGLLSNVCAAMIAGCLLLSAFLAPISGPTRPAVVRVAAAVSAAWVCVAFTRIVLTASELYGLPPLSVVDVRALSFVLFQLPSGRALLVSLVLTVIVAIGCHRLRTADGAALWLVVSVVAVLPPVAAGHASTGGSHQVVVSALLLHVAAAVVWIGGLLALILVPRRSTADQAVAVGRFSTLALGCFLVTAATGVIGAAARIEGWTDLTTTTYGLVITGKTVALLAIGGVGWWHRQRSLPALAEGRRSTFVRIAGVEILIMAATMGLAVGLSRTPPPNDYGSVVFETPVTPMLRWIPEPVFLAVASVALVTYVTGVRVLRRSGSSWPAAAGLFWICGWILLLAAASIPFIPDSPPWTTVRHLLVAVAVPALLAAAAPVTLARRVSEQPGSAPAWRRAVAALDTPLARFVGRPQTGIVLYAIACYGVVLTAFYDWDDRAHEAHVAAYAFVVAAGCVAASSGRAGAALTRVTVVITMTALQAVLGFTLVGGSAGTLIFIAVAMVATAVAGAAVMTDWTQLIDGGSRSSSTRGFIPAPRRNDQDGPIGGAGNGSESGSEPSSDAFSS